MPIPLHHMVDIASEALAEERRFCALPDDRLTPWQLIVKRERKAELERLAERYGDAYDRALSQLAFD